MSGDIKLGMPADDVLLLPGYTKEDAIKPPEQVGEGKWGLVRRFYPDVTVTFKQYGAPFGYRVSAIGPRMDHDDTPTRCEWTDD